MEEEAAAVSLDVANDVNAAVLFSVAATEADAIQGRR